MELVVERQNLQAALKRVRKNKGSPGIDGMTVDELPDHLRDALAAAARATARGDVPAVAGETAAIPKSGGGDARAWHPDRARPIHPAGHPAGPAAAIRPDLLASTATAFGPDAARTTRS